MESSVGAALAAVDGVGSEGGGHAVKLEFSRVLHPAQEYEIRIPLYHEEQHVGSLSLRRPTTGRRLYTDVRLVAQELVPSLAGTLARLPATGPDIVDSEARR